MTSELSVARKPEDVKSKNLVVLLTEAEIEELRRIGRDKYDRAAGAQARVIVREWLANEQAAEAGEDAA